MLDVKREDKTFHFRDFQIPLLFPVANNRDKVSDLEVICLPSHSHLMRNIDQEAAKNREKCQLFHFDV